MSSPATLTNIEGTVAAPGDEAYERLRAGRNWNALVPDRYPRLIVAARNARDVCEAVRYARREKLNVAVRSGGHNWVGVSLRDDTLLLDLRALDTFRVDLARHTATVGPAVRGIDLNHALDAHDLAFPVGHCSSVGLGGFLLAGGLGWNGSAWGPACFGIRAADVVTADGCLVTVNEERDADLLWAMRGAGAGFFGVVTRFELALQRKPRAITSNGYCYPLACLPDLGAYAADIARELAPNVELTLFCMPAPPPLREACRADNGYVAMLAATAFAAGEDEARAALRPLERRPMTDECLDDSTGESTPIAELLRRSDALWPEGHRFLADTAWLASDLSAECALLRDRFRAAPAGDCLSLTWFATGPDASQGDAAFSMPARALTICYAVWDGADGDERHGDWHRDTIAGLDRFAAGHYIGESDIVARPERHRRCFTADHWARLQALRDKYDPDGLFCGPFG